MTVIEKCILNLYVQWKKKTFLIRSIKDYYINSASNIGRKKKKKGDILTKSHLLPDLSGKSTLKKKIIIIPTVHSQ